MNSGMTSVPKPEAVVRFRDFDFGTGSETGFAAFGLAEDAEVTMEANPGTLNASRLKLLKDLGINRLSLGVQSFDDNILKTLGRAHSETPPGRVPPDKTARHRDRRRSRRAC